MDNSRDVVIIIPVLNQLLHTKRVLHSIEKHRFSEFDTLKTVIIDNGSDEETKKFLFDWLTQPKSEDAVMRSSIGFDPLGRNTMSNVDGTRVVITNEENKGFGPAVNQGIRHFMSDNPPNFLVMNNDMELIDGCVDELYKTAHKDSSHRIVGGKLLLSDNRIQHAGAFLNVFGWGQHLWAGIPNGTTTFGEDEKEMEYVTGALFFIRSDLIQKIVGFDERFAPAYFEEVDYCYAARNIGYKTIYCPTATAYHFENTTGKEIYGGLENVKPISDGNQLKFYSKWDKIPYESDAEHKLLMTCKIYGEWSFSIVMRNLAKGLSRNGVDVSIAPEEYHMVQDMMDWEVKAMINKPNDWWDRTVLRSSEGDHMYLMPPGKKRIAHTTGENSVINQKWVDQLNHVDQVITTSTFFKGVLETSGVTTDVKVLPNSVDVKKFHPGVTPSSVNAQLRGMNLVGMFAYGDRKNPDALFQAFTEEFTSDDDITLTVHSLSMAFVLNKMGTNVRDYVKGIARGRKYPPIFVTSNYLHEEVLPNFMNNYDLNVVTSRGEGFGNSIIEFGALGIPSIVTGYSGVTDFIKEEEKVGWLIDYEMKPIPLQRLPYFRNYVGGEWAEIDINHLRKTLRFLYNNRTLLKEYGQNALKKVRMQYSIEAVGEQAKQIIFGD